jgi:hypothetical protein
MSSGRASNPGSRIGRRQFGQATVATVAPTLASGAYKQYWQCGQWMRIKVNSFQSCIRRIVRRVADRDRL